MEIGAYIEQNREALAAWGEEIRRSVCDQHFALLKVPAAVRVKIPTLPAKNSSKRPMTIRPAR